MLPEAAGSWTYVLDSQRIPSHQTQGQVAAKQLQSLLPLLPARPLLLADGYYGSQTFLRQTQELACDKLLRLARNRVLCRPAPPRTGRKGAPKKDGARFACGQSQTHGAPDEQWSGVDRDGQRLEVACWQGLHFKGARAVAVSLVRVTRPLAAGSKRDPRVSWFVLCGQPLLPLSEIAGLYRRRYSLEHGYRVDKQHLLWATPRLRTPEAFDRWTLVVSGARNQLCLARPLMEGVRQPWESRTRAVRPKCVGNPPGGVWEP